MITTARPGGRAARCSRTTGGRTFGGRTFGGRTFGGRTGQHLYELYAPVSGG